MSLKKFSSSTKVTDAQRQLDKAQLDLKKREVELKSEGFPQPSADATRQDPSEQGSQRGPGQIPRSLPDSSHHFGDALAGDSVLITRAL